LQLRVFGFAGLVIKKRKKSIEELRGLVKNKWGRKAILYIPLIISTILYSLFVNENIWFTVIAIYFISKLFYYLKRQPTKNYFVLFFIALTIPIFTAQKHLNNINYTIMGLSKEYSKVSTIDSTYTGIITFKSANSLYLNEHTEKGKRNIIIPNSNIQKVIILDTVIKPKKGLDYFKENIEYFKEKLEY
jgi:hypothetical protein